MELHVGIQAGSDATAIKHHNRIIPQNSIVKPAPLSEHSQWFKHSQIQVMHIHTL